MCQPGKYSFLPRSYFEKEKEEMLELDFYELSCRLETDSLKLLLLHSDVLTRKNAD